MPTSADVAAPMLDMVETEKKEGTERGTRTAA